MRILGIDYGTKKLGFALSDEGLAIAFPKIVLPNDWPELKKFIGRFVADEGVSEIVIGLPVGLDGKETELSAEVRAFAQNLEKEFGLPVHFENEAYSSAAVRTATGEMQPKNIDAASAAVILQSFLDRRKDPEGNP
ncbi:MAG: Holliday junction resolvase RuvX [Candidatus Niyogibacteria bacterium]|nr:Holliday junction resolvase RuvX [Candidatus Niyogibacteria bacterium]